MRGHEKRKGEGGGVWRRARKGKGAGSQRQK